jgi:hypothetical protein
MDTVSLPMKLAVEFAGTLFFLSVIISTGNWAAIGAALALVAFLGGGISGGHYNPAVTLMFFINKNAMNYLSSLLNPHVVDQRNRNRLQKVFSILNNHAIFYPTTNSLSYF